MRVHELAKAVGLESKEVIAIAKKHRVAVKASPSANVEDKDVRKLMPYIDKYKGDLKAKAEEDKQRKEEERARKEEERRKKEAERRKALEDKRKAEEEERRKKEEEERKAREEEVRRRAEEERKKAAEQAKAQKEMEERMRAAGLRVPTGMKAATRPEAPPAQAPRPAQQQPRTDLRGGRPDQRPPFGDQRPRPDGQRGPRPDGQRGPRPDGQRGPGQRPDFQRGPRPDGQRGPRPDGQRGPGQRPDFQRGPRPDGQRGPRPDGQRGPRPDSGGRPEGRPGGGGGERPIRLTQDNLPQIGVMRDAKPASRRDRDKKGGAAKDKGRQDRRKPKPSRIFELGEDMTVTNRPRTGRPAPGGGRRVGGHRDRADVPLEGPPGSHQAGTLERPRRVVTIEGAVTVGEFASKCGMPATEVIKQLLLVGEMLTVNAPLTEEHMDLLASEFNIDLTIVRETDEGDVEQYVAPADASKAVRRPPVVTIMGHVDHGKTTLLDRVRSSNVVDGEFGGITQHIGAYHVTTAKGDIVFLDTPGHEAFTAMRARGASVTDLVILVVGADDGFMPQTIEAVNHAQAAKVPIVVAVNKVDLPQADPAKIRQQALQHNLVPEEFGGDTMFIDISAKKSMNLEQLLEMVALQAEVLDLKAEKDRPAEGIVIESHIDPQRGAVATILVQRGTLKLGDAFVVGSISGSVRAMNNDLGRPITEAGPSFPAEIIGLEGSPSAGEVFTVMPDERTAREVAEKRQVRRRTATLAPTTRKHISLEGLSEVIAEGQVKELPVILKGDVQGSLEAVRGSLEKIGTEQVRIRVIHMGVGGVNESDVNLAAASDAVIIGFNVRPEAAAAELAQREGVDIKLYRIIYDLIEDLKKALTGILEPKFEEKVLGHAEVRQLFKISRVGTIAGCYVTDGEIARDSKVRLLRDSVIVYEGQLSSLKRFKDDVKKVGSNTECGLSIENYNDLKEGDIVEAYTMEQVAVELESAS